MPDNGAYRKTPRPANSALELRQQKRPPSPNSRDLHAVGVDRIAGERNCATVLEAMGSP